MSPSTVMRLKDCSTETLSAHWRCFLSITASVVMNDSIVAMFGSIMPAPFANPPIRTFFPSISHSTAISLANVSLVMMACAARLLPSAVSAAGRAPMLASIFSIGSCTPMRPVEQTMTCRALIPSAFPAASAMRLAFSIPTRPVQAFALPALATIARTSPPRRCIIETRTGAAFTRFVVKVAAPTDSCAE